jgi:methylated-DNA-[protein]-cysteine S-methyltransferase
VTSSKHQPYQAVIDSPIPGVPSIGVRMTQGRLRDIDFLFQRQSPFVDDEVAPIVRLLRAYLDQGRDLAHPIDVATGTPFQQRLWRELTRIPFGETRSYGELAKKLNSSARAVAGACRRNPLPLLVPCHRVVAKNGPGGFMGCTDGPALEIKRWLLQHEGHE